MCETDDTPPQCALTSHCATFMVTTLRAQLEPDCFADEIAIDFPSMGHLVARVRRAFLADAGTEQNEPLTAQVSLSSDEAQRGTVVPVEILVRAVCDQCGGRGEVWAEPCESCEGNGHLIVPRWLTVAVPRGVADGTCLNFRVNTPHDAAVRIQVRVAITA